ncbi:MAG TPA: prolipoprotein diacylglyceryl transferase [Gemmatimonadaceae bacterium]|nr:prolipoprotein diacylglyceryl transferase [Gemmatimonadaceae bacterium]
MPRIFATIVHHPLSYQIGPFNLTGFGLAILLTFVVAQLISQQEMERRGHDPAVMGDLVFAAVVGGLLGAKIYYAVLMHDWGSLASRAGFVFWGGLIGGIIATAAVMRWKKLSFARISDVSGIALAAGYSVGRTGCWAVGDDYGRPWNGFLATKFPEGAPASTVSNMTQIFGVHFPPGTSPTEVVAVHPTQLYEVTLGFVMFLILWRLRDHKHAEGWLFGLYCVLAGIERFIIEFVRAKDDRIIAGGLTVAQLIAIGFIVAGLLWMNARKNVGPGKVGIYATA